MTINCDLEFCGVNTYRGAIMNDKPAMAKNPALRIQAAKEKIMFGAAVGGAPQRAVIISPGKDNKYTEKQKGGIATRQIKPKPAPKPAKAKSKPSKPVKPVAAKPTPKPKPKKKKISPAQQSKDLAEGVILSFTYRLIDEARAKGGYLSVSDLKELNKDFEEKTVEMKMAIEKSFDDYIVDHERKSWINSRTRPFDRMIVKTFSHLLEDESRKIRRSKHVSRQMLPGFFIALNLMLGTDVRDSFQGKCRAIVKIANQQHGSEFDWDDIYDNEDARAIVFDALVDIAGNFSELKKRRDWFVDLINSHLVATPANINDDDEPWTMTPQGFDEFFDALISELRVAVSMDAGRSFITRRHDAETTENLVKLMKNLSPTAKT